MESVTKRLHVSGLTPSITAADLSKRLGTFGSVTALDGYGRLDGLGEPRKYAYVTLDTTKAQLARCLNVLSGTTWKGAKLRIGEAKPDYRERIQNENDAASNEPPKKRRKLERGIHGVHASDMSLVTPENAEGRPGWRKTPLGRIIRPVRMRPARPLPEPVSANLAKVKADAKAGRKKKRVKAPPVRARRRTIDPTRWGPEHLKGTLLGGEVDGTIGRRAGRETAAEEEVGSTTEQSGEEKEIERDEEEMTEDEDEAKVDDRSEEVGSQPRRQDQPVSVSNVRLPRSLAGGAILEAPTGDIAQEKRQALDLLQSLFGDRDEADWGDRESLGSDIDVDDKDMHGMEVTVAEDSAEEVPVQVDAEGAMEEDAEASLEIVRKPDSRKESTAPISKLKDLFAPREEAAFSLLGHLDLDLELDDDIAAFVPNLSQPQQKPLDLVSHAQTHVIQVAHANNSTPVTFDPSTPMFFPLRPEQKGKKLKDILDVANETGRGWRDWLREWKRRHREAVKSRRRRGGGDGGD